MMSLCMYDVFNMSLYNLLHGINDLSPLLLRMLDLDQKDGNYDTGRFRDIYLNEDGTKVILLTRNGGGNREEYQSIIDHLATHPEYIRDYDDDFDCTYAYIEFNVPKDFLEQTRALSTGEKPKDMYEKTQEAINVMKGMTPEQLEKDERFGDVVKVIKKITEKLK